jgi:hypothetical protein
LLCASVGKLEVFSKFHSISRCFNFNLFFVCCFVVCCLQAQKTQLFKHTSIHKKY